jgi:hypothetical protein
LFKEEFADGEEESATLHRTVNLRGAFALEQTAQDKRKNDPHICSDFVTNSKRELETPEYVGDWLKGARKHAVIRRQAEEEAIHSSDVNRAIVGESETVHR